MLVSLPKLFIGVTLLPSVLTGVVLVRDDAPPDYTFDELCSLTTRFMDAFMYPNNTFEANAINSTLSSVNVIGRVDTTRNFIGRELNTDLLGTPISYKITRFAGNQNIVDCPIEILLWMSFNAGGEISQYDVTFRYLQWNTDDVAALVIEKFNLSGPADYRKLATNGLVKSICQTAMDSCNGTNTQYESMNACADFLTNKIPFGQIYQLGWNTLTCRGVHTPMVPLRPDVHCSHVGPSGGQYCVSDRVYNNFIDEPLFTFQPFVPFGYADPDPKIAAQR